MRLLITFFTLLSCTSAILAQESDFVKTNNAKESLRIAQDFIAQKAYSKAKRQLLHTIKVKPNFAVAHRILGKVLLDSGAYDAAIEAYEASFELDDRLSRAAFFECGEAYLYNEQADFAFHYYQRYEESKGKRYANASKESALELIYDDELSKRKDNCSYVLQLDTAYNETEIIHLGKNINSEYDEYLPSITSDGQHLLFTRNIKNENENIYLSNLSKQATWQAAQTINGDLNTANNEGMAKFEAHGNTFYFAGCNRETDESGCDIYKAAFKKGKVTTIETVEGHLNSYYWDSQPTISCDGQVLYFSSTRLDGYGGADIWKSTLQANGEWGVPENLGPSINTPADEEAPFLATDGLSLYFTSDGHQGQGNGDIFVSWWEKGAWSIPENMGFPINSPAKEIGFYIKGDNKTAYFASSRKGGLGGLDIYEVEIPSLMRPSSMVQLEVFTVDKNTQEPIVSNILVGNNGTNHAYHTNEEGWLFLCLAGERGYSFQVKAKGYETLIDAVFLENQDNTTNHQVTLQLAPTSSSTKPPIEDERLSKTIVQLYFDFDSCDLDAKNEDKLKYILDLLERYDDWQVEVIGFADNQGNETYNKELSNKRAQRIVEYLKTKSDLDIETNINAIGKGSTGSNENEFSRRKSRRVDVVLTR